MKYNQIDSLLKRKRNIILLIFYVFIFIVLCLIFLVHRIYKYHKCLFECYFALKCNFMYAQIRKKNRWHSLVIIQPLGSKFFKL